MSRRIPGGGSAFGGAPSYGGGETTGAGTKSNPYRKSTRRGQGDTRSYEEQRAAATRQRNQAIVQAAVERDQGVGEEQYVVSVNNKSIRASPEFASLAQKRFAEQTPRVQEESRVDTSLSRMKAFVSESGGSRYITRQALKDPVVARRVGKAPVSVPAPYSASQLGIGGNARPYDPYTPPEYIRPVKKSVRAPGRTAVGRNEVVGYVDTRTGEPAVVRPGRTQGFSGVLINTRTRAYNPDRGAGFDAWLSKGGSLGEFAAGVVEPFRTDPLRGGAALVGSYVLARGGGSVVEGAQYRLGASRTGGVVLRVGRGASRLYAGTSSLTLGAVSGVYPREAGRAAPFAVAAGLGYARGYEDASVKRLYFGASEPLPLTDSTQVFNPRRQAGFGAPPGRDLARRQTQLVLTTPDTTPVRAVRGGRAYVGGGASPSVYAGNRGSIITADALPKGATYAREYAYGGGNLVRFTRGGQTTVIQQSGALQGTLRPYLGSGGERVSSAGRAALLAGRRAQARSIFSSFSASSARGRFVQPSLFKAAVPSLGLSSRVAPLSGRGFTVAPLLFGGSQQGYAGIQSLQAVPRTRLGGRNALGFGESSVSAQLPRSIVTPSIDTGVLSASATRPMSRQNTILGSITTPINPSPNIPGGGSRLQPPELQPPPPPITPMMPPIPFFGVGSPTKTRRKSRRGFQYETSLTALFTGATTPTQGLTLTGGEIRPRISRRKR